PMGLSGNDLVDGDNVKFYFLPWDPVTYEPLVEQATYLVNINVTVQEVIFDGAVTVTEGTTFEFTACNEPYNTYEVNATTDMGALDATGLTYNASDEWYATYGSFLLESIAGIANEPWAPDSKSWAIFVNDAPAPMGLSGNDLVDGDNVKFYFLPWDPVTYEPLVEQATYLVNINVSVPPPPTPTPRPHHGGGGAPRDSDRDGYSDVEEILAGTKPNDPNDYPGKPAVAPTPLATPTPSTIVITPTLTPVPTPMTTPTPVPATPTPEEPGFDAFFAIAGLITVAYLVLKKKRG
ncbi:MAG: PGF-CTERM sorting domain-containing protein, partial [Euryarchaeota archaeon]|nr:PGF-CTERM sorting domain-containing protein [Euryarchaeota archaeon]